MVSSHWQSSDNNWGNNSFSSVGIWRSARNRVIVRVLRTLAPFRGTSHPLNVDALLNQRRHGLNLSRSLFISFFVWNYIARLSFPLLSRLDVEYAVFITKTGSHIAGSPSFASLYLLFGVTSSFPTYSREISRETNLSLTAAAIITKLAKLQYLSGRSSRR